jgi:hypothetical protein
VRHGPRIGNAIHASPSSRSDEPQPSRAAAPLIRSAGIYDHGSSVASKESCHFSMSLRVNPWATRTITCLARRGRHAPAGAAWGKDSAERAATTQLRSPSMDDRRLSRAKSSTSDHNLRGPTTHRPPVGPDRADERTPLRAKLSTSEALAASLRLSTDRRQIANTRTPIARHLLHASRLTGRSIRQYRSLRFGRPIPLKQVSSTPSSELTPFRLRLTARLCRWIDHPTRVLNGLAISA